MSGAPKQRLAQSSEQLSVPRQDPGTFENIPKIPRVAGDSAGPRVKGKVVIITGCNSPLGIGRASAHQFANNGAKAIYICDFNDEHLGVHQRELKLLYPAVEVHVRQFDAADEPSVKKVVEEALEKYGRLDIMFANAGIVSMKLFYDATSEEFMKMMRTNVLSVFLAAKYAAKAMKVTSASKPYPAGSIIATASVAGLRSNAGTTDYSASKAAVISIMQTASYQLAGTGIRCNALCPGVIETGMTSLMYEMARAKGTEKKIGQLNPLKRGAVADEVARVALFLGSDEASYVNGQAWAVCGGLSAGHPFVPGKLA
ncbi:NAD(P)-binding protein [Saccharata proteae CBS 121410]|uniref:NAD(P)-binding protein n=1 Tax=Saccharata proteae CBS 121410 TaxID=1314787 RepID=A0A6A5YDN1_9PEZI|nr:NAD(P)-binding protein [Saccharata proteae CBS 121410]